MRRAARIDANHNEIVTALRKVGCSVQSLAAIGKGVPDLLCAINGQNHLMEVKDGSKPPSARKLTADEVEFAKSWQAPVHVVDSVDGALKVIGAKAC